MHDHGGTDIVKADKKYVLIGNPNVVKSVIFGILTGRYVVVSNYPGTTVEVSRGTASFDKDALILDTPGINNLIPMSEDEVVTRNILLEEKIDKALQVIDTKNLRRGLLITCQLAEMGIPFMVALNMADEARERGIEVDTEKLEEILGVRVVKTIATQRKGTRDLAREIPRASTSDYRVPYDPVIEEAVEEIQGFLPGANISRRSLSLMIIAGDDSLSPWIHRHLEPGQVDRIRKIRQSLEAHYREPMTTVINNQRLKAVDRIIEQVQSRIPVESRPFTERIGALSMHPVVGLPILLIVLYLTYLFVGVFGAGIMVDYLQDKIFEGHVAPAAQALLDKTLPFPHIHQALETNPYHYKIVGTLTPSQEAFRFVHDLLVGEYGVVTVALSYSIAIVLPIVTTFFFAFGILEDSGYLPRLAVMVNSIFARIGLNGKAVLPLVLGLGCATMATLTARILETRKERVIVTLLLALGVPCSAQLGVILGMLGPLPFKGTLIWSGVITGVLLLVGYLASKVVQGDSEAAFLIEVPPMRVPQVSNIAVKTMARIEWYLKEAVPLFILGTLVLFALDRLNLMAAIQGVANPLVVGLLGLPPKATEAFLIGFLRRDYGAAGLFALSSQGLLDPIQTLVSLVTMTLFVPCIANVFMIVKERGFGTALAMILFIFPVAFAVGGALNFVLRALGVVL